MRGNRLSFVGRSARTSSVEKGRPPAKPAPLEVEDLERIRKLIGAGIIKKLRGRGGSAVEELFERGTAEKSVEEIGRAVRKTSPEAAVRREVAKVKERVQKQSSQVREQLRTTAAKKADVVKRAAGRETAKVKREVA